MEAREPRSVLEELRVGQVVVCDGAMGTMLHAAGVPLDAVYLHHAHVAVKIIESQGSAVE